MFTTNSKRFLLFFLTITMVCLLLPAQVFADDTAAETQATETTEGTEVTETAEPTVLSQIQSAIDDILTRYLGTLQITTEEINAAVGAMDADTYWSALIEVDDLENSEALALLSEEDQKALVEANEVFSDFGSALYARRANDDSISLFATTVTPVEGSISVTDSIGNGSLSNGTVTIQAKGGLLKKATNTITITNETENKAKLSFSYSASKANSFTIAGASATASGTYTTILDAGDSVTLKLVSNSGLSNTTATLTLSNFSLTAAAETSNVTIQYDSSLGSVTAGGNAVSSGGTVEGVSLENGIALVATPNDGVTFLGWIDTTDKNSRLSADASYTYKPSADATVQAVFVTTASDDAWFLVDNTYLTDDLNEAGTLGKNIVLMNNGTLAAGDYTIASGDTLLIPFDDAHTCYTSTPKFYDPGSPEGRKAIRAKNYEPVSPYRTLTMESGAHITVDGGSISVSGKHAFLGPWNRPGNIPIGKVGMINMLGDSEITVNSGNLYAWGYIYGTGTIELKSGAKAYELFTVADYPGGTQASSIQHDVFPFSQYFVQNIETALTIHYGAKLYVHLTAYVPTLDLLSGGIALYNQTIPFIVPSDGLFNLKSGYMVKDYIESEDRVHFTQYGNMDFGSIALSFGTASIDSKNYILPFTSNMTYHVASDTATMTNRVALIPGAELIIDSGACVKFAANAYVYDSEQWGNYSIYSTDTGNGYRKFATIDSIGGTYIRKEADLIDARVQIDGVVDGSEGYLYTTSSGANIFSTGSGQITVQSGEETVTYQCTNYDNGTYDEIPVTPAQLKNGNGSYTATGTHGAGTYTYIDDFWHRTLDADGTTVLCDGKASVVTAETLPTYQSEGSRTTACGCGVLSETVTLPMVAQLSAIAASADAEVILDLKFYLPTDFGDGTVTATFGGAADSDITKTTDKGRYVVSVPVASGYMTKDLSVSFKNANGDPVSVRYGSDITATCDRSVTDYVQLALDSAEDGSPLEQILEALVTYGGYAQTYFDDKNGMDTDSENPAYSILGTTAPDVSSVAIEAVTTYVENGIALTDETKLKGNSSLDSAISHRVYIPIAQGNYTFTLTYPVNHKEYTKTLKAGYDEGSGRYYVDIENIPAAYLDYVYTITVDDGNDNTLTVKTSVLAYLSSLLANSTDDNQKNLARAMYLYNQAANTFFGK